MLTGHFAIAFFAKRAEPKLSLGTAVFAALLSDLLWCVLLIVGVESIRVKSGITSIIGVRAIDVVEASRIDYSHSLLTTILWGVLLAGGYFTLRRNSRVAWILFGLVVSHWLLDFASHTPDMPLMPGSGQRFGLGLWTSLPATLLVEGIFWVLGIVAYTRLSGARNRAGFYGFWIVIVFLTLAWIGNIAGPPPSNLSTVGFSSLTFFSLSVVWAYWMNRVRKGVDEI